jgi:voltage-gated potassium channel Kch
MGILGYRKRTGFLTGLTVAQISEFSLILMAAGMKIGHVNDQIIALITAVGIITITVSTYLITYGGKIYKYFAVFLSVFEKTRTHEAHMRGEKHKKPIILIGFHRIGRGLAHNLNKEDVLIIDFDPSSIPHLQHSGYSYIFGDISDQEVFDAANCSKAQLVISTSPDQEDNLILINNVRRLKKQPQLVLRAETEEQADFLYKEGADYVLLPHLSSGHALGQALANGKLSKILAKLRNKDQAVMSASFMD